MAGWGGRSAASQLSSVAGPDHRVHTLWLPGLLRLRPSGPDPVFTLNFGLRGFLPVVPPPFLGAALLAEQCSRPELEHGLYM